MTGDPKPAVFCSSEADGVDDLPRPVWAPAERFEDLLDRADGPEPEQLAGLDLARGLLGLADWGRYAPEPEVRAVAAMLRAWLDDGAGADLGNWLGVVESGSGSVRQDLAIAQRGIRLRSLLRLEAYRGLSANAAAAMIATRWNRWQAANGGRLHEEPANPEAAAFWALARAGIAPASASTIRRDLMRDEISKGWGPNEIRSAPSSKADE
ncbi:hypothetical protein [Paracoccus sp. SCSIO 75233]|uniref:hypothetical protein n=1 Tax=Paracoccus sp. SCSIO 75233 TaxID=3017782 RepID=UPI0022F0DB91|nr:hypothetical protein [Paracoccus sp. SCSIO 75233]WBU51888.1 hypothetical protein PAF12_08500 [Paracoccus sp. SCSIO 75233]